MPVRSSSKSGSRSVFRTTDKCVQAEMKNKVEVARLQLQVKILDRQKSYSAFTVEKDKRQALAALARMRTTSGLSMHGVAPDGPADRTHEDSPYFKSYRPLSEKRLVRWKAKEKELQRMLQNEEDILIPPWERDPSEDMSEKFGNMMRMLGYSVEDDDMKTIIKKEDARGSSDKTTNGTCRRQAIDPFECLKNDCDNGQIDGRVGFQLLKPQKFSVDAWNKRLVENYKQFVTNYDVKPRRAKSATSRMEGNSNNTMEPKSKMAWTSSTNATLTHKNIYVPRPPSKRVRPHTASGTSRTKIARDLMLQRPSSAGNRTKLRSLMCKKKSSERIGNAAHQRDNKECLNTVDESEQESCETDSNYDKGDCLSENTLSGEQGQNVKPSKFDTSDNSTLVHQSCLNNQANGGTEGTNKTNSENKPDSKKSIRDPLFLINTLLNADKKQTSKMSKVSFSDEAETQDAPPKTTKAVKSVQQLVKLSRDGTKLANYDMKLLEENLEDISGVKDGHQVNELFKRMPENRERRTKKDLHITKAERRIALISHRHKKELDPLDDVLDSDEDGDDGEVDLVRRMPQWKRDLMAEAPPGLFGPKSPAKVVVAMSKAQRKRELDALVKENISDVRKIIEQENARRIRDRLHVYFTMKKLNEAAEKVTATTKRN